MQINNFEDDFYNEIEEAINCATTDSLSEPQIHQLFQLVDTLLNKETKNLINQYYQNKHQESISSVNYDKQPAINIIIPYNINQARQAYFPIQYFNPPQPQSINNQLPMVPMQPQVPNYYTPNQFQQASYLLPNSQTQNLPKKNKVSKSSKKTHKSKKKDKKKEKKHKEDKEKKKKETIEDDSNSIDCSSGVFQYLFGKYSGNPCDRGIVQIVGNSLGSNYARCLPRIIDDRWRDGFWCSSGTGDRYVEITFNNIFVKIKKYRLKVGFPSGSDFFASWTLSATTRDGRNVDLDKVNNSSEISRNRHEATFSIQTDYYVKSVRLTMDGKGHLDNAMRLRNIEFYGLIKNS